MYTQEELGVHDSAIYQWYLKHGNHLQALFSMTTHDYSIKDALYDYLEVRYLLVHCFKMSCDCDCGVFVFMFICPFAPR